MKLKNTSASQVTAWDNCPRYWHFGWVKKLRTSPTASQQRGTYIHDGAEYAQKNKGELKGNEWDAYVRSLLPFMSIGQPRVKAEGKIWIDTAPGLPRWLGFIDLLDGSKTLSEWLRITDYKSTSDFRYAKTPDEISEDSQTNSYARWAFEQEGFEDEYVQVGLLYVKAAKKTPKKPKVKPVFIDVDRAQVATIWERDLIKVEEMVRAAEIENSDDLPPLGTETGYCKKYGGCPHRSRCGITAVSNPFSNRNGKGNSIMTTDFLERLKKATSKGAGKDVEVPTGVLPPDAPSRTTKVKAKTTTEPETEEKPEAEEKPEPKAKTKPKAKAKSKAKNGVAKKNGFALYIDCFPVKRSGGAGEPTLFEDWLSDIVSGLNEEVLAEKNLPDYRLLPFSEEKALFALRINDALKNMPTEMVVSSAVPGARDALAVLIPHASDVVRGIR